MTSQVRRDRQNGVISWVWPEGEKTRMTAYNWKLVPIAELVEDGENWSLHIGGRVFEVEGRGCKDPIEFVERMVAPPRFEVENSAEPWLMRFVGDGISWEVWSAD
jgi:hypothetical protein